MSLFQPAPSTPEEMEKSRPLDLSPDEVAELSEDAWYEKAYRGGDAPQLTWRAVGTGSVLGFFLAFTNVYLGLKIGWHIGVALSSCILSFSIWSFLHRAGIARTPMTILENNCMQSTASAAGYATGSTLVSALPALLMLSVTPDRPGGQHPPVIVIGLWVLGLAVLGTSLAIPMKRNMVNHERLKFPSGTASAVLLRSLYSQGAEAIVKARALLVAALFAGAIPLLKDLDARKVIEGGKAVRRALLPGAIKLFDGLPGVAGGGKTYPLSAWNVRFDYGPALIAAGGLVGVRVTLSMVAGALALLFLIGPEALGATWVNPAGIAVQAAKGPGSAWRDIGVWVGAPVLVSSGILSFAFQWRTIARAVRSMRGGGLDERTASIEVPNAWFVIGAGVSGAGVVALAHAFFEIPVPYGVLAVGLTFLLALVASRATGETDVTPTGAMGKIMQLAYGVLIPQNASANLMTAGITSGASSACADLLQDLKAGYLLGAAPRRQYIAQMLGVLPGTIATVLCYFVLVPDATALTGEAGREPAFPAPAAQQWLAVAKVFKMGIGYLHPMARQGIFWGLVAGAVLASLERLLPKRRAYLPSATGVGLGLILPFYQPLAMFTGAVIAAIAARKKGSRAAELVVPVASGLIAGESIVGVVVAALNNFVLK